MRNKEFVIVFMLSAAIVMAGCAQTVYERKQDKENPADVGMETKVKLEGPRAVMETKF